jgi:MoaA/NifB/PqqE/SkfB family radical SAM enzyme
MTELSVKDLAKILTDAKELGCERFDITGGEPTIRKDLGNIIQLGKSLDYKIELVTNGSLLTRKKLSRFKNIGLDSIAISLDGSNYATYSRIRRTDEKAHARVLQTIEDSVQLGFYTKVNTVAFNSNLRDLPAITEFCIKKGVNENGIYYFTPVGRGGSGKESSVEPSRWLNFIRKNLVKYSPRIKLSLEVPLIEKNFPAADLGCILKEDPYHLQILPDGNVYPCAILASYHKPIANLHEKSIKEVWNSKKLWQNYCNKVYSEVFKQFGGFCFDSVTSNYDPDKYKMVCPIRKITAGEFNE